MVSDEQRPIERARELVRDLRDLRYVDVPTTLVPNVLVHLGLSDGYWTVETPLGPVYVAYSEDGISAVRRAENPATFEEVYRARSGRRVRPTSEPPESLARAVDRRLRGEEGQPPRFDLRGLSEFERAVLLKALEIPRGEVRPYAWVAREIGRPRAVRAVGTALAGNPIPLLIPCHRVVRSDGDLGRYSMGGSEAKRAILAAEGVDIDSLEAHARKGVRFYGSDTTHIYCFPTCRHVSRVSNAHLVLFSSWAAAEAAGYRPCKVCRPATAS